MKLDSYSSGHAPVAGLSGHISEPSGSMKGG